MTFLRMINELIKVNEEMKALNEGNKGWEDELGIIDENLELLDKLRNNFNEYYYLFDDEEE